MTAVAFRQATLLDIPGMIKVINDAKRVMAVDGNPQWTDRYPNEVTLKTDVFKGYAYVLVDGDRVVATGTLWQEKEPAYQRLIGGRWTLRSKLHPYAVIHRVAVDFEAQGRRYSERLLHELEQVARQNGYNYLRVDTNVKNKKMQRVLERNGYSERGKLAIKYVLPDSIGYDKEI
jgi:GNAT superfamily N-acetyltransferase